MTRASTLSTSRPDSDWEAVARRARGGAGLGDEAAPLATIELLVCNVGETRYAIRVERVREIVRPRQLTPVPRTPSWVLGVVSLRGEVVQVVDLRRRLGLETAPIARASRIVVAYGEDDGIAGVLVDAVRQVLRVDESALRPAAAGESRAVSELCVVGEEFVSILDLDRVLSDGD